MHKLGSDSISIQTDQVLQALQMIHTPEIHYMKNGHSFKENNSFLFQGTILKGKNLLPEGQPPFSKDIISRGSKSLSAKIVSFW